jgi:hypothetical protein
MIGLSEPALYAITRALLTHRTERAEALAYWQKCSKDPLAPDIAACHVVNLATVDNAMRELQAVLPTHLGKLLQQQIDLIHAATPATQSSNQEPT